MRMSSDDESDASRMQRQAVSGTPQEGRGVERYNLSNMRGASMVVRLRETTSCSDSDNQPSTSQ